VDPILFSEWVIGNFTLNTEAIAYLYPYGGTTAFSRGFA